MRTEQIRQMFADALAGSQLTAKMFIMNQPDSPSTKSDNLNAIAAAKCQWDPTLGMGDAKGLDANGNKLSSYYRTVTNNGMFKVPV